MTPNYVAVREEDGPRGPRLAAPTGRTARRCTDLVVDSRNLLVDDVRIREFLLAPLDRRVADLMDRRFVALKATDDDEPPSACSVGFGPRYRLPTVRALLIGIVTIDDVLDVAEATATREIQRIGGSKLASLHGRRNSRSCILALFVPLIISSGGIGSQAATRSFRLAGGSARAGARLRREVAGWRSGDPRQYRVPAHQLWSAFSDIYGPHWLLVAVTVSVSLVGVVLWGTLSGSLLPFLLKRSDLIRRRLQRRSWPLVDVTGLVIYFSVALVVLRGTLL